MTALHAVAGAGALAQGSSANYGLSVAVRMFTASVPGSVAEELVDEQTALVERGVGIEMVDFSLLALNTTASIVTLALAHESVSSLIKKLRSSREADKLSGHIEIVIRCKDGTRQIEIGDGDLDEVAASITELLAHEMGPGKSG